MMICIIKCLRINNFNVQVYSKNQYTLINQIGFYQYIKSLKNESIQTYDLINMKHQKITKQNGLKLKEKKTGIIEKRKIALTETQILAKKYADNKLQSKTLDHKQIETGKIKLSQKRSRVAYSDKQTNTVKNQQNNYNPSKKCRQKDSLQQALQRFKGLINKNKSHTSVSQIVEKLNNEKKLKNEKSNRGQSDVLHSKYSNVNQIPQNRSKEKQLRIISPNRGSLYLIRKLMEQKQKTYRRKKRIKSNQQVYQIKYSKRKEKLQKPCHIKSNFQFYERDTKIEKQHKEKREKRTKKLGKLSKKQHFDSMNQFKIDTSRIRRPIATFIDEKEQLKQTFDNNFSNNSKKLIIGRKISSDCSFCQEKDAKLSIDNQEKSFCFQDFLKDKVERIKSSTSSEECNSQKFQDIKIPKLIIQGLQLNRNSFSNSQAKQVAQNQKSLIIHEAANFGLQNFSLNQQLYLPNQSLQNRESVQFKQQRQNRKAKQSEYRKLSSQARNPIFKIYQQQENKWLQLRRDLSDLMDNKHNISIQQVIKKVSSHYEQLRSIQVDDKIKINAFSVLPECKKQQNNDLKNGNIEQKQLKAQTKYMIESKDDQQNEQIYQYAQSQKCQIVKEVNFCNEDGIEIENRDQRMSLQKSQQMRELTKFPYKLKLNQYGQTTYQTKRVLLENEQIPTLAVKKGLKVSIKQCLVQYGLEEQLNKQCNYLNQNFRQIQNCTKTNLDNQSNINITQTNQRANQLNKSFQRSNFTDRIIPYVVQKNKYIPLDQQTNIYNNQPKQVISNIEIFQVQQESQQQFIKARLKNREYYQDDRNCLFQKKQLANDLNFQFLINERQSIDQKHRTVGLTESQQKVENKQYFQFNPSQNSPNQSYQKQDFTRVFSSRDTIIQLQIQLLKFAMGFQRGQYQIIQRKNSLEREIQITKITSFFDRVKKPIGIKTPQLINFMRKMANSLFLQEFGFQNQRKKYRLQNKESKDDEDEQQDQFSQQMLQDLQFQGSQYEQIISLNDISNFVQMKANQFQNGSQSDIYQQFFDQAVYDLLNLFLDELRPYGKVGLPPVCFDYQFQRHKIPNSQQIIEIIRDKSKDLLSIQLGIISISGDQEQIRKAVADSFKKYNQKCCKQFQEDWDNIFECQFEVIFELMEEIQRQLFNSQFVCILRVIQNRNTQRQQN